MGQEHIVAGPFIPNTVCCPQVRAIEYHPNGIVKRVEFVADTPLPSPASRWPTIEGEDGQQIPVPDISGRDIRKPLPSVGP